MTQRRGDKQAFSSLIDLKKVGIICMVALIVYALWYFSGSHATRSVLATKPTHIKAPPSGMGVPVSTEQVSSDEAHPHKLLQGLKQETFWPKANESEGLSGEKDDSFVGTPLHLPKLESFLTKSRLPASGEKLYSGNGVPKGDRSDKSSGFICLVPGDSDRPPGKATRGIFTVLSTSRFGNENKTATLTAKVPVVCKKGRRYIGSFSP